MKYKITQTYDGRFELYEQDTATNILHIALWIILTGSIIGSVILGFWFIHFFVFAVVVLTGLNSDGYHYSKWYLIGQFEDYEQAYAYWCKIQAKKNPKIVRYLP